jgi:Ca2+-binding EF-hand superfamily protein
LKLKLLLAAVVAAFTLSPLARAADTTPNDKSVVMAALDPDNGGTVSLAEARKAAEAKFNALDTDHEGTLDASELTGIMSAKQIKGADKDNDGTIDKAEYLKVVEAKFGKADKDHDGTLDKAELSSEEGRELVAMLAY